MLVRLSLAIFLMLVTVAIQIEVTVFVLRGIRRPVGAIRAVLRRSNVYRLGAIVMVLLAGHLIQVLVWALAYLAAGVIERFEEAFYFSMVTFTTLGYGDVVLDEHWRLLGSFEAAVGIIMFGWTTAIVVAVVHKVYLGSSTAKD